MTCEECEQILMDGKKGAGASGWMPGVSVSNLAKAHAQSCSACAAKMCEISHLDDALHQLRISSVGMEAPATIETSLLAAFRERTRSEGSPVTRVSPWRLAWVPAAALLIVAVVVALYSASSLKKSSAHKIAPKAGGRIEAEHPVQQSPTIASGSVVTRNRRDSVRNRLNGERTAAAGSIGVTARVNQPTRSGGTPASSVAERNDLALNGGSSIVRVTLPLSSLVAMGIPVHPDASDHRVTADVMMDPFGAVVGIRLVAANTKVD
jgi:hypothetical protein